MIGILIFAQKDLGQGLLHSIEHVLGEVPPGVEAFAVDYHRSLEQTEQALREHIARLDNGAGVLILADIYGASHSNAACRVLQPGHLELVSGVNLPMLIRALNYRERDLATVTAKALSGGTEGIIAAGAAGAARAAGDKK